MADHSPRRFWRARSRRRLPLLLTSAAAVGVLAFLLGLAAGLALRAPADAVRDGLASVPLSARSLTIATDSSDDQAAQGAVVGKAVRSVFGRAPVTITRHATEGGVNFRIAPVVDRVTTADLPDLQHGFARLPAKLETAFATEGGIETSGTGGATTETILKSVEAVRETSPVPLVVLAVAGIVALAMLSRILVIARTTEDRLLRSRGASSGLLVVEAGREAALVAVPSTLLGGAASQAVLAVVYGAPSGPFEIVAPNVGTLLAALVCPVVAALVATSRPLATDAASTSRGGWASSGGLAVLLLLVAAVSVWRYRGAPNAAAVLGDPLALVAAAAIVAALAVVATTLLPAVLLLIEKTLSPGRALPRALAVRFTARNVAALTAPALLLALAIGVASFAAGATATTQSFLTDSARLVNGGAQSATLGGSDTVESASTLLPAALRSTTASNGGIAPVLRMEGAIGDQALSVLGLSGSLLPRLTPVDPHLFDAPAVSRQLHDDQAGATIALSGALQRASTLRIGLQTTTASWSAAAPAGAEPTATATFWLVDGLGDTAPVTSTPVTMARGAPRNLTATASMPAGGPWRIAAIDLHVETPVDLADAAVGVTSLEIAGRPVDLPAEGWAPRDQVFGDRFAKSTSPSASASPSTLSASIATVSAASSTGSTVRLLSTAPTSVPLVISDALAQAAGLRVGDAASIDGQIAGFDGRVTGITPVLPGTTGGPAALADLPALTRAYLATSEQLPSIREVWGSRSTSRLADFLGTGTVVTVPSTALEDRFVRTSALSLWFGAVGGALFALLTVAATLAALQRTRRDEIGILRALGVTARIQALVRITEPAVVTAYALVTGALVGLVATLLVAPAIARTGAPAAPAALPIQTAVAVGPLAALLGAIVAITGVFLVAQFTMTARSARGSAR